MDLRSLVSYYQEKDKGARESKEKEQPYPVDYAAAAAYYSLPIPQQYNGYNETAVPATEVQEAAPAASAVVEKKRKSEVESSISNEVANPSEAKAAAVKKPKINESKPEGEKEKSEDSADSSEDSSSGSEEEDGDEGEEGADEEGKGSKKKKKKAEKGDEYSVFHGNSLYDYQGRTYLSPPSNLRAGAFHECFMPKKLLHQWRLGAGKKQKSKKKKMKELKRKKMLQEKHGKPSFSAETVISKPKNQDHPVNSVNAIRLFPRYGHILISANLDGTVKLYDLYNERRCLRTFYGHTRGVRDIQFNYDGGQFLSASFDRTIKLWDTETGQCIQRFSNRKMVYCVKYHPKESYQNNFLAGCADNRVHQWDVRTGNTVQEYNYHLGPINAIEFIDEGRRFISSSDDKSLRVWEYGIPVEIKEIREPYLHSMPVLAHHPTSLDYCTVHGQSDLGCEHQGQVQDEQKETIPRTPRCRLCLPARIFS